MKLTQGLIVNSENGISMLAENYFCFSMLLFDASC